MHDIIFLRKSLKAFTMAEVLIALVVIGVIAAITMTTVMPNIQERVNSQRQANIVYKVTQATNLMKANGAMTEGFASTDAFVDELQKYLKIMKRCDSEHIAECWPTKKVRTSEGKEFEVSKAKNRSQLGFSDNYANNKNVGIVLTDGASLIMTYDPSTQGISIGSPITAITTDLPSGGRFQTFLEYTSNTTAGLAFVMDVNGGKGPNSETIGSKMHDIRNLNGAHFSQGCGGAIANGLCVTLVKSYSPLDCSKAEGSDKLNHPENSAYCTPGYYYETDNLAGGKKACDALGLRLADSTSELRTIYNNKDKYGINGGRYFTKNPILNNYDWCTFNFTYFSCAYNIEISYTGMELLCVGEM